MNFKDIAGQEQVKRALQITAAGNHGVLMVGTDNSNNRELASRISSILPPMEEDERLQTTLIHSIAGEPIGSILNSIRTFHASYYHESVVGMLGGGISFF